jgi:hypothetical protein
MTPQPKTLRELLAEGQLQFRTRDEVEKTSSVEDAATLAWMRDTKEDALAVPRRAGRPALDENRPKTRVRSIRLTVSAWDQIDETAEALGCSVNRFIEQTILERLSGVDPKIYMGPVGTDWNSIPTQQLLDNYSRKNNILSYTPSVAA